MCQNKKNPLSTNKNSNFAFDIKVQIKVSHRTDTK